MAKRKDAESTKAVIVQVDDLLIFQQFSKKSANDAINVCNFKKIQRTWGMKVLTGFFHNTSKERLGVLKSVGVLYSI